LLAAYFLQLFSGRYNKPGLKMDESAEIALRKWTWPGNIRELQHSIERAVILTDGKIITERSFQFNTGSLSSSASYEGSLEEVESRLFQYAIRKHNGNMTAVAAQLGVSRQTLYNKIKKYGL
jgi:DNA-binding NtrC family response regulator